jgi:putative transposase
MLASNVSNTGGGVRKADLKAYAAVRRIQENPELGAFRVRAALAREGIHLSARTVGRILADNRRLYGLEKPEGPAKGKREMPFEAQRRHQFWSADVSTTKRTRNARTAGGLQLRC